MSGEAQRGGGTGFLVLVILIVVVGGGVFLWRTQAKEMGVLADELAALKLSAKELSMRSEALIGDRANLKIERNKLKARVTKLEGRGAETEAALEKALADLERTRQERDDYQGKALDLGRRLEDALSELAKGK